MHKHIHIPGYEIREEIGKGAFGTVYLATDSLSSQTVAIKVCDESFQPASFGRGSAWRLAVFLTHKNIIRVLVRGTVETSAFIVMEYISDSLSDLLDSGPTLHWHSALQISIDIALGLQHAHIRGFVHGDLKPSNIHITDENIVKISDFGLGDFANGLPRTGYTAPELLSGSTPSPLSDVYSLGVLLSHLITGTLPAEGKNETEVAQEDHLASVPQVHDSVKDIIKRATQVDPNDRYISAGEMADDLKRCLPPAQTPTWLRNLVKTVWANWQLIGPTEERRSANSISKFLSDTFKNKNSSAYAPEPRTVSRILSPKFRKLWDQTLEMADNPAVPFGEGWPDDSDDIAYLASLIRSWGPEYSPEFWGPHTFPVGYERSTPGVSNGLSDTDGEHLVPEADLREQISEESDNRIKPDTRRQVLPLSKEEVAVALQLKGILGWPECFDTDGEERRRSWTLDHPLYNLPVPGELAIIRELAIRKKHSEDNGDLSHDNKDLLGILLDRPWHRSSGWNKTRAGVPPWSFEALSPRHVFWNTSWLRWNSTYSEPDSAGLYNELRTAIDQYIASGDRRSGQRAESILSELCPPAELSSLQMEWFDRPLSDDTLERIVAERPTMHATLLQGAGDSLALRMANQYHRFITRHILHAEKECDSRLDANHLPQHGVIVIGDRSNDIWMPLTLDQWSMFGEHFTGRLGRRERTVYCGGCQRYYVEAHRLWNILNRELLKDTDLGLVEHTFELLFASLEFSRHFAWGLGGLGAFSTRPEQLYGPENKDYDHSSEKVGTFLKQAAARIEQNSLDYRLDGLDLAIKHSPNDPRSFLRRSIYFAEIGEFQMAIDDAATAKRLGENTDDSGPPWLPMTHVHSSITDPQFAELEAAYRSFSVTISREKSEISGLEQPTDTFRSSLSQTPVPTGTRMGSWSLTRRRRALGLDNPGNPGTSNLSQADRVRDFVIETYIRPALERRESSVTVRAGDVASEMNIPNRQPSICSAMTGKKIEQLSGALVGSITGPNPGANCYVEYLIGHRDAPRV